MRPCVRKFLSFVLLAGAAAQAALPAERVGRGKFEWVRLQTPSPYWNRHMRGDPGLLQFLRKETPLQVEPSWRTVSADDVDALCEYPFIYAHDIRDLRPLQARNLAEYIRRGGFVFIDFCVNSTINPSPAEFLELQYAILKPHLAGLRKNTLPPGHEIFSIYFKMVDFPPQTRPGDSRWTDGATNPMCGFYLDNRMVVLVGLSGFQCSWDGVGSRQNAAECMKMAANIHIYAMTR